MIGESLGPYKILEPLGAGGMGEVYLGEDTRLGRKVAIKVLPAEFASDPERLARFEQEARAAAALNHPHIAVVHDIGFETGAGEGTAAEAKSDPSMDLSELRAQTAGVHFIVQECLEGQTLGEALGKGALPLPKALAYAAEIGEALDAAHAAGIVHRDLKPANVFITAAGHVKVLDFGLAKLTEMSAVGGAQLSMSPTTLGTVAGQVMGTAGYMSPEQINAEEVDHRSDVFAFGCLLYEMATGKRAFGGETVVDTLHAVMRTDPINIRELNAELPAELQRIQNKCVAKDAERRYQHVADLVVDLKALRLEVEGAGAVAGVVVAPEVAESSEAVDFGAAAVPDDTDPAAIVGAGRPGAGDPQGAVPAAPHRGAPRWLLPIALIWAVAASAYALFVVPEPQSETPAGAAFTIAAADFGEFEGQHRLAVAPDGSKFVYRDEGPSGVQLWMRRIDERQATPIPGTAGGLMPFFSADSRSIGFVVESQVRIVDLEAGTAPIAVAQITSDQLRGAYWGGDGTILVGRNDVPRGLAHLNRADGTFAELTHPELLLETHRFPQILPDGRILFTIETAENNARADKIIAVLSPETGDITPLEPKGTFARWVPTGHLLYVRNGTLVALPFDLESLEATGPEVVVVTEIAHDPDVGAAQVGVSDNGLLVYETGKVFPTRLAFVDREGGIDWLHEDPLDLRFPRISPDGRRISVGFSDGQSEDVWMFEVQRRTFNRFTNLGGATAAHWSPDGRSLVFESPHAGSWSPYLTLADGVGEPTAVDLGDVVVSVYDSAAFHPLGNTLVFGWVGDIHAYDIQTGDVTQITDTPFTEGMAAFSPDGEWIAYAAEEQGRQEVYATTYPEPGRRWLASLDGGREPVWSKDGTELFYRRGADMMSVKFKPDADPPFSTPERLFSLPSPNGTWTVPNYDVTSDGRFVMLLGNEEIEPAELVVVVNWFEELKERVPTGQ